MRATHVLSAIVALAGLAATVVVAQQRSAGRPTQDRPLALVGGTLIDGTGGDRFATASF